MKGEPDEKLPRIKVEIPEDATCAECGAKITPGAIEWRMIELQCPGFRVRWFFCPREFPDPGTGATTEQYVAAYEKAIATASRLFEAARRAAAKAMSN